MNLTTLLLIGPLLAATIDVRELQDNAFTPPESPGHLWFLKQIDRFMLYISVSNARGEDRERIVRAISRFGFRVMTNKSLTDSQVRLAARIMESVTSRGAYQSGDIEKDIIELAWYLSRDLGIDMLASDGFLVPPARQTLLMELLKTRLGSSFRYLGRLDTDELKYLRDCYQLILNHSNGMVMNLGFDVSHIYPALREIETGWTINLPTRSSRMERYSALVDEAMREADTVINWSMFLNMPHMAELSRQLTGPYRNVPLIVGIKTCSSGAKPEAPCNELNQIWEALHVFPRRQVGISKEDSSTVMEVLRSLSLYPSRLDSAEWRSAAIASLGETAEQTANMDPSVPGEDFPLETVSHVRIKTHLVNFVKDNQSVAKSVYLAIHASLNRLTPQQLEWIDYFVHTYLSFEPDLQTVCRMAFKLAQSCGIKLFDFYQPAGLETHDLSLIRSVVSYTIWTQWEGQHEFLGFIFEPVVDLGIPLREREAYASALKLYTEARMEYERRPIRESRDLTWSGFLPDQLLMNHRAAFVELMLEYKDYMLATAVIPKLPKEVKEYIGSLVSPLSRFDGISKRISNVYRTRMDSRPRDIDVHVSPYSVRKFPGKLLTLFLKLRGFSDARDLLENVADLTCRLLELLSKDSLQDAQIARGAETIDRTARDLHSFAELRIFDSDSARNALESLQGAAEALRSAIEILSLESTQSEDSH